MTNTDQPDLKPVIGLCFDLIEEVLGILESKNPDIADHIRRRKVVCTAARRIFQPNNEIITHDELLALYKQWGGK